MAQPSHSYQAWAICGLLLLMVGVVFGQTLRHELVNYDDDKYVYANPQVLRGLSIEGTVWALTNRAVYWGPFTWLSLMLDRQLYGPNAGGYHLTNVLLHAATAVVLFLVLLRMTGRAWASALAVMLFAVHPLRVESVAWVTERKDVLSGLFFALTLAAYVGYVRHPFSLLRYLAVMILFALGLMAKASLVTLPALLLLLDYWPLGRFTGGACQSDPRSRCNERAVGEDANSAEIARGQFSFSWRPLMEKLPLLALVAGSCAATVWSQREALGSTEQFAWSWRIGNALMNYVRYLGQFFYPVGMAAVYPRPGPHLPWAGGFAASLVLVALTAGAFVMRRRCPYLLVGWLWYLGMLLPMIGLVQFGAQTLADRFTYLPQVGLCIALAWAVADGCRASSLRRWAGGLMTALVLLVLMGAAWRQTSFWHDSVSLWTHTLACTSKNWLAHYDLAVALADRGRQDEAMVHYQKTVDIAPRHADAHGNLGIIYASRGQYREAMAQYREALKLNPQSAEFHNNVAYALLCQGRLAEAELQYRKALELDPRCATAHNKYGTILVRQGRFAEALAQFRQTLEVQPDFSEARYNLARLLATCPVASLRNGEEAVEHARRLDRLYPIKPDILDCLAVAYAEAGRFAEAIATTRRALDLAVRQNNRPLANVLQARIAQYEAGKPFHLKQFTHPCADKVSNDRPRTMVVGIRARPSRGGTPPASGGRHALRQRISHWGRTSAGRAVARC
jgi:Flp pilus assembly protein TadD